MKSSTFGSMSETSEQNVKPCSGDRDIILRKLYSDLCNLIVESRIPGINERGYGEGVHCPPLKGPNTHCCDLSVPECQKHQKLNHRLLRAVKRNVFEIEVLLLPDCCPETKLSERILKKEYILLERWTVNCIQNKVPSVIDSAQLLRAARSFLYFSQISAWLSSSRGKSPSNIYYWVRPAAEMSTTKFETEPESHTFPICKISEGICGKLEVKFRPRTQYVPIIPCSKHPPREASFRTIVDDADLCNGICCNSHIVKQIQKSCDTGHETSTNENSIVPEVASVLFSSSNLPSASVKKFSGEKACMNKTKRVLQYSKYQSYLTNPDVVDPVCNKSQISEKLKNIRTANNLQVSCVNCNSYSFNPSQQNPSSDNSNITVHQSKTTKMKHNQLFQESSCSSSHDTEVLVNEPHILLNEEMRLSKKLKVAPSDESKSITLSESISVCKCTPQRSSLNVGEEKCIQMCTFSQNSHSIQLKNSETNPSVPLNNELEGNSAIYILPEKKGGKLSHSSLLPTSIQNNFAFSESEQSHSNVHSGSLSDKLSSCSLPKPVSAQEIGQKPNDHESTSVSGNNQGFSVRLLLQKPKKRSLHYNAQKTSRKGKLCKTEGAKESDSGFALQRLSPTENQIITNQKLTFNINEREYVIVNEQKSHKIKDSKKLSMECLNQMKISNKLVKNSFTRKKRIKNLRKTLREVNITTESAELSQVNSVTNKFYHLSDKNSNLTIRKDICRDPARIKRENDPIRSVNALFSETNVLATANSLEQNVGNSTPDMESKIILHLHHYPKFNEMCTSNSICCESETFSAAPSLHYENKLMFISNSRQNQISYCTKNNFNTSSSIQTDTRNATNVNNLMPISKCNIRNYQKKKSKKMRLNKKSNTSYFSPKIEEPLTENILDRHSHENTIRLSSDISKNISSRIPKCISNVDEVSDTRLSRFCVGTLENCNTRRKRKVEESNETVQSFTNMCSYTSAIVKNESALTKETETCKNICNEGSKKQKLCGTEVAELDASQTISTKKELDASCIPVCTNNIACSDTAVREANETGLLERLSRPDSVPSERHFISQVQSSPERILRDVKNTSETISCKYDCDPKAKQQLEVSSISEPPSASIILGSTQRSHSCVLNQKPNENICRFPGLISKFNKGRKLLGNFEESILKGCWQPVSRVNGFKVEIGASGSFCPDHLKLPADVYFYELGNPHHGTAPYVAHVVLGNTEYYVPKKGAMQVTLFNPTETVVKMFVLNYDLSSMPALCHTFIRQKTYYMPIGATEKDPSSQKWLRYIIHLRFASSRTGKIYLHKDFKIVVLNKSNDDAASDHIQEPRELRSFLSVPKSPMFSNF